MARYDSKVNLEERADELHCWGYSSSIGESDLQPPERGHVVEIAGPHYVSRPCWEAISSAATHIDTVSLDLGSLVEYAEDTGEKTVYQFFFSNLELARDMHAKVSQSARNKRKDHVRQLRLFRAGGFHDKQAMNQLFDIQQGRCYYSGHALSWTPKNFVIDHIQPINLGGTDWPSNLALALRAINTWKGGTDSVEDTLLWLAKTRGKKWLISQRAFCLEVDKKREELDLEFRRRKLSQV